MLQDLRYAIRRLLRAPRFTVGVVIILGVGIGMTAGMGSVLDALLFRTVGIPHPERLVGVMSVGPDGLRRSTPLTALAALREASPPLEGWCAYSTVVEVTQTATATVQAAVEMGNADCLSVLGIVPAAGRAFSQDEAPDRGAGRPVALISHRFWQRAFAGAQDVLGQTVRMQNTTLTIVGILPAHYTGLSRDQGVDILVPINTHRPVASVTAFLARLPNGSSTTDVLPVVRALWPSLLESAIPAGPARDQALAQLSGHIEPLATGFSTLRNLYSRPVVAMAVLAAILLLLTAINVASLLVARVTALASELAVMRSLGATTSRLALPLLVEAAIVTIAATLIAIPLAYAASAAFGRLLPVGLLPWALTLTPDIRVVAAAALTAIVLAAGIAVLPMWLAARTAPRLSTERTVTRSSQGWGRTLLAAQLVATVVIVFACALMVRSFTGLIAVDRGFHSDRVLSVRLTATPNGYQGLDQATYFPALVERLAAMPGVESVGFARYFGTINAELPPQPIGAAGADDATTNGALEFVSPRFFATVGIPLLRGRDVAWSDLPRTRRVALVSDSLARALDPSGDVVGRVIRYGTNPMYAQLEIVGVVGNTSLGNYRQNDVRLVYVPALQVGEATSATVHLRATRDPLALAAPASAVVASFGREHVQRVATIDDLFTNGLIAERMAATVTAIAATLALVLACLGVYVLLSYAVAQRTREIGVRVAVGATPRHVSTLLLRELTVLLAAALVVGLPVALAGAPVLRSLVFGITTTDPSSLLATTAMLAVTVAGAALGPVRRARRLDPVAALRSE